MRSAMPATPWPAPSAACGSWGGGHICRLRRHAAAGAVVDHRQRGRAVLHREPQRHALRPRMPNRVRARLARHGEQRHVDVRGHAGSIVRRHVEHHVQAGAAQIRLQLVNLVRSRGGHGLGRVVAVAQHANHRADVVERGLRRGARRGHCLLRHLGIALHQPLGRGKLDAHRRERVRRDVVHLAGDAHALLLHAAGGLLLARTLGLGRALLHRAHVCDMRAVGVTGEHRRHHESDILEAREENHAGRLHGRAGEQQRQHRRRAARDTGHGAAFGRHGIERHQRPDHRHGEAREPDLQAQEDDQARGEHGQREAAAQRERHHRHAQAHEHLQVGHHVDHAEILAKRQVGNDDRRRREHKLQTAHGERRQRHRGVDQPVARRHVAICHKKVIHAIHGIPSTPHAPYAARGNRADERCEETQCSGRFWRR